jgi:hypothetical protein
MANLPPFSTTLAENFATSFASVVDTGGEFATGVNNTGGKFAASVNDTSGNLPPVSMTPAANLHRWQILGTISDLKVNLKAKMYPIVNSTSQRCPN